MRLLQKLPLGNIAFAVITLFAGAVCACALQADGGKVTDSDRVQYAIRVLAQNYDDSTGLWKTEGWWNAANTVTALGDAASSSSGDDVKGTLQNTLRKAPMKFPAFLNEYYDDEGWWALAWIQAYDITRQKRFLEASQSIFENMATGWDNTCAGGIWWRKDRHYKNAIANELFLSVAAHLANRTSGKQRAGYLAWALREWKWFDNSGMVNSESLVNDGLTSECKNNGRNTWTYNQGVVLGGLSELSKAAHDESYLRRADAIATAAIAKLTDADNVLHDKTEPNCSADTVQFKGIFVRNLNELQRSSPNAKYATFLRANATSVWQKARDGDHGFACSWTGPPKSGGAAATTSALDALNAAR